MTDRDHFTPETLAILETAHSRLESDMGDSHRDVRRLGEVLQAHKLRGRLDAAEAEVNALRAELAKLDAPKAEAG